MRRNNDIMLTRAEIQTFHKLLDRMGGDLFALDEGGLSPGEEDRHLDRLVEDAISVREMSRALWLRSLGEYGDGELP